MRKLILGLSLASLFFAGNLNAQKQPTTQTKVTPYQAATDATGFYMGVRGGYNLPMNGQNVGFFGWNVWESGIVNYDAISGQPDKVDDVPLSLGKGANIGIDLGYMFTNNIGAELGINYLIGGETTAVQKNSSGTDVINQSISAKMFQLSPVVVLKANPKTVTPYAKFGLVVGISPKVTYEEHENWNSQIYELTQEVEGGTPLGFTGSLGADYALNSNMSIFGELRAVGLTYAPEKGKMTRYTENGNDILNIYSVAQKEYEFLDSYTENTTNTEPSRFSRIHLPFSSIGLNVGFKYKF